MRKPAARRAEFDQELVNLQNDLLMLGSMVEKAILRSIDALRLRDLAASDQIVKDDNLIDAKRFDIEERCIDLIARQQPLAG
ncbi:MAG: phosphate transport system regulatory protein PhoU, partial [Chloroflexota bacterium]|nr:phosphate transport system regulatory protein PhoU [Chloroflexota bacterium]